MDRIDRIVKYIDLCLVKNHKEYYTAIEANKLLDEAGILRDRPERHVAPLREILRAGLISHAYQFKGKHSKWYVPHS